MTALNSPEEKELLILLKSGDRKAFERLYHQFSSRIHQKLLRLTASEILADELLQDTFIALWEKRQLINPDQSVKAWLYKVAINNVYLTYRKIARDKTLQERLIAGFAEAYSHVEEAIYLAENRQILYNAIEQLSPQRRQVFTLCKLDGKSYDEAAWILGISSNTVSSHMVKATQAIRQYLFQSKESIALIIIMLAYSAL